MQIDSKLIEYRRKQIISFGFKIYLLRQHCHLIVSELNDPMFYFAKSEYMIFINNINKFGLKYNTKDYICLIAYFTN